MLRRGVKQKFPHLTHHSLIIKDFIAVRYSMKVMC